MVGGMKTKAGRNRTIPIAKKILPLIESAHNVSSNYLIEENGEPVSYHQFLSKWKKSELVEGHFPHDGRHTCETALDNAGTNKRIIQLIIGHAGKDVDDNVYTHKTLPQLVAAIDGLSFV